MTAEAVVLSYHRFETDLDPDPFGLETPNEVFGLPALVAASARIDDSANPGSLPNLFVPGTGAPNTASLDGLSTSGNPDANASADYSALLDVAELTAEMFVRTEEQVGVLVARSTSANVVSSISDGFRIYDPANLKVQFYTEDLSGNVQLNQISTSAGLDDLSLPRGDGIAEWRHVAFTYDQTLGIGQLYLDGQVIGSASAAAGSSLYWGPESLANQRTLDVGFGLDGYNFSKTASDNGYIDEVRISSGALTTDDFLLPESRHYGLIVALVALGGAVSRRK
ncbi:MAG: LamG-like jellyroll fold domain-containing protein [Verrucomicrobiota bacterium]